MRQKTFIFCAILSIICLSIRTYTGSAQDKSMGLRTVVIDAGHGGKDPGCVSRDKKTYEKTIALNVATSLKEKINKAYPDVKVILTRSDNKFVPLETRARIASQASADLFISIHVNAQEKGTNAHGSSVHILGQSTKSNRDTYEFNREICRRENSVILLEDDRTAYQGLGDDDPETTIFLNLMATAYRELSLKFASTAVDHLKEESPIKSSYGVHQDNFAVLRLASMPAVLVELGFITNPSDLAAFRADNSADKFASALFSAFAEYKLSYDASLGITQSSSVENSVPVAPEPAVATAPKDESETAEPAVQTDAPSEVNDSTEKAPSYGIQIFATSRILQAGSKEFLGYQHVRISAGAVYKYVIAPSDGLDEVKAIIDSVKKTYPDAFIVRLEGNTATRVK